MCGARLPRLDCDRSSHPPTNGFYEQIGANRQDQRKERQPQPFPQNVPRPCLGHDFIQVAFGDIRVANENLAVFVPDLAIFRKVELKKRVGDSIGPGFSERKFESYCLPESSTFQIMLALPTFGNENAASILVFLGLASIDDFSGRVEHLEPM